jgi:hypothetical protein
MISLGNEHLKLNVLFPSHHIASHVELFVLTHCCLLYSALPINILEVSAIFFGITRVQLLRIL